MTGSALDLKPCAILGGAFGFGLKRNVLDIYKFVCRNYRSHLDYQALQAAAAKTENRAERCGPWQSDDIFGFGFSRRFGATGGLEERIPERAFERPLGRGMTRYGEPGNTENFIDTRDDPRTVEYLSETFKPKTTASSTVKAISVACASAHKRQGRQKAACH